MNTHLSAKYDLRIKELEKIWRPVGDIKTIPKSLRYNLKRFMDKPRNRTGDELSNEAVFAIESTLRVIKAALHEVGSSRQPINKKADQFLKRLAHDTCFERSVVGANRFDRHLERALERSVYDKQVCARDIRTSEHGWKLERLTSQAELAHVGGVLGNCVKYKDEYGSDHHNALYKGDREYWVLHENAEPIALIQVNLDDGSYPHEPRVLETIECKDEDIELSREVKTFMLSELDVVTELEDFLDSGIFPEFASQELDYDKPHHSVKRGDWTLDFWYTDCRIFIATHRSLLGVYDEDCQWKVIKFLEAEGWHDYFEDRDSRFDESDEFEDDGVGFRVTLDDDEL